MSCAFNQHLATAGMACKLMTHGMPQHNGVVECLNWMLLEQLYMLIYKSGLPKTLWGKALQHVTWLKNHMATCTLNGKTPYEAIYGHPPDLFTLHLWGCTMLMHDANGSKLDLHTCEV